MDKERGSIWRRWDLHLHTPGTLKNDCYTGTTLEEKWENFYKAIEDYIGDGSDISKAISVVGITDYLSIQNYLKVRNDNRLPAAVKMILPNVEMRLSLMAQSSPVNIHFLFDPEIADDLESRFFGKLSFTNGGNNYSATKSELIRFGKDLDGTLDDDAALKKGAEQYLVELDTIRKLFNQDPELRKHTLIVVANSSTDGASGIGRKDQTNQTYALKKSLYNFVDAIFSAQPSDRKYFLGQGADSLGQIINLYGSLMPCIHGSDAHSIEKIFEPDQQRYCWIKADTTFEGLLQILYEPEERVLIQTECPNNKDPHQVIDCIMFEDNNFQTKPIVFNDDLTCIIGGKSTGKSLLLRQLASSIDHSYVDKQEKEMSQRKSFPVQKTTVLWKDGTTDSRRIVYIPQSYLSRTVDSAEEISEISKIIEDVLLQETNIKQAYEKYKDAHGSLCESIRNDITKYCKVKNDIQTLKENIKREGHVNTFIKTIEGLEKERTQLASAINVSDQELEEYKTLEQEIRCLESRIVGFSNELELLNKISDPVVVIPGYFKSNDGINIERLFKQKLDECGERIEKIVTQMEHTLYETWRSKVEKIAEFVSNDIQNIRKTLQEKLEKYKKLKEKVEKNAQLQLLSKKISDENIKLIEAKKRDDLLNKYCTDAEQLKKCIIDSQKKFKDIAEEYCEVIKETGMNKTTDLIFDSKVIWRKREFFQGLTNSLNNRNFSGFRNEYKIDLTNQDSIEEYDEMLLDKLWDAITMPDRAGGLNIKGSFNLESVLQEIFKDWYNIHYIVKSGDDTIEQMSPGKKALVLLEMLINLEDSLCPILIDQPEDDLDNRSIYTDLVKFIRKKKKERQIIVVTHNANIVLGSDAEEVIIANQSGQDSPNQEYRFEYRSGSIENNESLGTSMGVLYEKGIQTQICDILEGGHTAFEKRQNKYFGVK